MTERQQNKQRALFINSTLVKSQKQLEVIRNNSADSRDGLLAVEPKASSHTDDFNYIVKAINSFIKLLHPKSKEEPQMTTK